MKENHEAENVAVSEKSAEDGGVAQVVCASLHEDEVKDFGRESKKTPDNPSYPGDAALLKVIMGQYGITKGEACDWVLLAAEHMRMAA